LSGIFSAVPYIAASPALFSSGFSKTSLTLFYNAVPNSFDAL
jgi:hypothetical protein